MNNHNSDTIRRLYSLHLVHQHIKLAYAFGFEDHWHHWNVSSGKRLYWLYLLMLNYGRNWSAFLLQWILTEDFTTCFLGKSFLFHAQIILSSLFFPSCFVTGAPSRLNTGRIYARFLCERLSVCVIHKFLIG